MERAQRQQGWQANRNPSSFRNEVGLHALVLEAPIIELTFLLLQALYIALSWVLQFRCLY